LDPRDDRTSGVRSRLLNILLERMRGIAPGTPPKSSLDAPSLPPLDLGAARPPATPGQQTPGNGPQIPPLRFDPNASTAQPQERHPLTPITERSHTNASRSMSGDYTGQRSSSLQTNTEIIRGDPIQGGPVLDRPMNRSPSPSAVPKVPEKDFTRSSVSLGRQNEDAPGSRPDSKFSQELVRTSQDSQRAINPVNITIPASPAASSTKEYPFPTAPPHSPTQPPPRMSSDRPASPQVPTPGPPHPMMDDARKESITSPQSAQMSPHSMSDTHKESVPSQVSAVTSSYSGSQKESAPSQQLSGVTSQYSIPEPPQKESQQASIPAASLSDPTQKSAQSAMTETRRDGGTPSRSYDSSNFTDDAGAAAALYYMQQYENEEQGQVASSGSRIPSNNLNVEDDDDDGSSTSECGDRRANGKSVGPSTFERHPTASTLASSNLQPIGDRSVQLGRKPSGARAPQTGSRQHLPDSLSADDSMSDREQRSPLQVQNAFVGGDDNADARAALLYLEHPPSPAKDKVDRSDSQLAVDEPPARTSSPVASTGSHSQYPSSFAPSRQAVERKAKTQAQQEAHDAAVHRPGRMNGKKKAKSSGAGAWDSSEDEDEDSEEDEDADSDVEPSALRNTFGNGSALSTSQRPPPPLPPPPPPPPPQAQAPAHRVSPVDSANDQNTYSHIRPPRTLPQIPAAARQPGVYNHSCFPIQLTMVVGDDESRGPLRIPPDEGRRTYYDDSQIRTQAGLPKPGAARQSVWSQALDPGHMPGSAPELPNNNRDTFVQLEAPEQTMTKAFTPQGLLSAGIQDKQGRSAKKQEEVARESGASLINVPNKPPPPQTGLLGAITAHERERKREGGVGAALTEREREKRIVEERQRKLDEQQRQQMEQLNQGGQMFGPQFPAYNPMMANPMANPMMMNPMMTGGYMGYPGMMGGYNQQHIFAAQQAAQAYQQAMMAFSQGSQNGGDGGNGGGMSPLNPMMTGGQMGPMDSLVPFDPRMSMMRMPMMTPMGSQMPPISMPLGMQMTGTFDPRFGPSSSPIDTSLRPPGDFSNQGYGQGLMQSRTSPQGSPAHASPAGSLTGHRPADSTDRPRSPLNPALNQ
jgi:CCR4-NOT transcriptional complex subunit CAF120